jgi:hypothetical protein
MNGIFWFSKMMNKWEIDQGISEEMREKINKTKTE